MIDEPSSDDLRAVADFLGLVGTAPVLKDFHVVRAIRAIARIEAAPFALVFGGGTALARAHKCIRRMSEDVDFKIVSPDEPLSRNVLRQKLAALRDQVTGALQAADFPDAGLPTNIHSRNENRYTRWLVPYGIDNASKSELRRSIQIELTYAKLRSPSVLMPVGSFVHEAYQHEPEVAAIPCVSITERAAEKLVSLTRRTAMELAGLSRDPDPALVRHIYDLHLMRDLIDHDTVATMARDIALADADEFRNQYPAYHADIAAETRKALDALRVQPIYRTRYTSFIAEMVYGERAEFEDAMDTVTALVLLGLT